MKIAKQAILHLNQKKKEEGICLGEKWALEYLEVVKDSPEPQTEVDKLITEFFLGRHVKNALKRNGGFIHFTDNAPKKYLSKLNSLLNSKTEKTKTKRREKIIEEFNSYQWNNVFISNEGRKILEKIKTLQK